jgi:hypothetical protein
MEQQWIDIVWFVIWVVVALIGLSLLIWIAVAVYIGVAIHEPRKRTLRRKP